MVSICSECKSFGRCNYQTKREEMHEALSNWMQIISFEEERIRKSLPLVVSPPVSPLIVKLECEWFKLKEE